MKRPNHPICSAGLRGVLGGSVSIASIANRLRRDAGGSTAVMVGLAFTVICGVAGLAVDVGAWQLARRNLQGAADQAVFAAASNASGGSGASTATTSAKGVAAQMGFAAGQSGVTVQVSNPPTQGSFTSDNSAWEVVISQPQEMWFSSLFLSTPPTVSARAVAKQSNGAICILALDTNAGDIHTIFANTGANVTISNCAVANNLQNTKDTDTIDVKSGATITVDDIYLRVSSYCDDGKCNGTLNVNKSIKYSQPAVTDPYAARGVPVPPDCSGGTNLVINSSTTLNPGNYCGTGGNAAISVNGGADLKTNAASPKSGTLLYFPSVSGVNVGQKVADLNHTTAITAGTVVTAIDTVNNTVTISPPISSSTAVAKGDTIEFTGGTVVTLNPGLYTLNGKGGGTCTGTAKPSTCNSGDLAINMGATVQGTGVTIVLTTTTGNGINVGNLNVDDASSLNISAMTSGAYSGMALYQDPIAPQPTANPGQFVAGGVGVNSIGAGASANITGVVYFPNQALLYSGGSGTACTQLVAWALQFNKNASFTYGNCTGTGTLSIGGATAVAE